VLADRPAILAADWFPGQSAAVGQARKFVAGVLGESWPGLDDVLVMVSEIASNAVRHTASGDGGWFDVTVSVTGNTVRVEIEDRGSSSEPRMGDDGGRFGENVLTCGRGLRIVDTMADGWGHSGDELGRVVWFEVTAKPDA
jgi:anti-sigma regulatory factor (Ser/Thr protein kinase)